MSKEWIIEVLGDLRGFAASNDLPTLASQLDESLVVAATELAQAVPVAELDWDGTEAGRHSRKAG